MKKITCLFIIVITLFLGACSNESESIESSTVSALQTVEGSVSFISSSTNDRLIEDQNEISDEELSWTSENIRGKIYLEDTSVELLPNFMIDSCIDNLNNDFVECNSLYYVKTAIYDMNNDGEEDYLVMPFPDEYAGNSIPPLYLFVMENNKTTIINIPIKSDLFIIVLNSQTNGYYDLQCDSFGNTLNFNGVDAYENYMKKSIDVSFFPAMNENDITCIKVMIPYDITDYKNYYLKMCLFDSDFNKILISTSNDDNFNDIKYTKLPANGIYCFYIKTFDLTNVDLNNVLVEFQCVNAVLCKSIVFM